MNGERYSIVCDHLGTPNQAYDGRGNLVWEYELDIYGKVRRLKGDRSLIPFRFPGQYEDGEIGLYYNRFRYYDPQIGYYNSQDPIGLWGTYLNHHKYVANSSSWVDLLGLIGGGSYWKVRFTNVGGQVHHMPANSVNGMSHGTGPSIWMKTSDHKQTGSWGSSHDAKKFRARQKMLIDQKKWAKALKMDIDDIQMKFGKKYNKSLLQMIQYSEGKGLLTNAEGKRLRKQCK